VSTRTLIINRREHSVLSSDGRCAVPLASIEPVLLTHSYGGVDELDPCQFREVFVVDMRAPEELRTISQWLVRNHGIARIVALQEKSVLLAAQLRTQFGLAGTDYATALKFRDKVVMKEVASRAGIRVPRYQAIDSPADFEAISWPVERFVLKPRDGLGAMGVQILDSVAECRRRWSLLAQSETSFEVEEFVTGDIYHCDGVLQNGELRHCVVSKYVGNPSSFGLDGFLGTYVVGDPAVSRRMTAFTDSVLDALGLVDGVCHLELFRTPQDDLVLCEVACRPGGGLIAATVRRCSGVDLISAAIHVEAGVSYHPVTGHVEDGRCWGSVDVFATSGPAAPVDPKRFDELGIVEHRKGSSAGNAPRHSADYTDAYVFHAPDEAEWQARLTEIAAGA
jgi:hypothetical protein